jgi:3-deoxy-D-manno-octulosonate 8-phosphate phosphatase KdsC-like HAD superfamily phosphatase
MLRRAGVGAAPSDATPLVRDAAALRLTRPGGAGAVREMCDLLIEVRRGARADKPAAVEPEKAPDDGDVIPFPFGRN